jgi:hypothetical protein
MNYQNDLKWPSFEIEQGFELKNIAYFNPIYIITKVCKINNGVIAYSFWVFYFGCSVRGIML